MSVALVASACASSGSPGHLSSAPAAGGPGVISTVQDVAFASLRSGWLVLVSSPASGNGSTTTAILGTTTAGETWRPEWDGPGYPGELVAIDRQHALLTVQGAQGCSAGTDERTCSTRLLATSNGGRTWVPLWRSRTLLTGISFANARDGLAAAVPRPCSDQLPSPPKRPPACPGDVLRTSDGGRHWSTVMRARGPILAVAAAHGTWWAVQSQLGIQPTAGVDIWASTDHGAKWSKRGQVTGLGYVGQRAEASLVPEGGGQAWLSLLDFDSCAMHGCGVAGVWHSTNNGKTWSDETPVGAPSQCGLGNVVMAAGPGGQPFVSEGFNLAACPPPAARLEKWTGTGWGLVRDSDLLGVTAMSWPTATAGYVVAGGALVRTSASGHKWAQAWPAPAPTGPLAPTSDRDVIAGGDATDPGAILRTSDDGATWSPVASLPGKVTSLDFANHDNGLLVLCHPVTNGFTLEASTDGGRTWKKRGPLPYPRGGDVSGLWMTSASRALVLVTQGGGAGCSDVNGAGPGLLWATGNGGQTWHRVGKAPIPVSLATASFAPTGASSWSGWVEGGQAHPMTTTDTGARWVKSPGSPSLAQVQELSSKLIVGWDMARNAPVAWYSTDGGSHWAKRKLPESPDNSVGSAELSFRNANDGWWVVSGTSDDVWATHDAGRHWQLVP